ncbi:hypothetical protein CSOJ01_05777 [Colletotrichum sojae]|uniref:Uncharacterized protein n=1 Tax=Colletotrichum sojae TaxID=2175907 RepID=A0A8H6JE96_9PEZI|nr:hypothetical protein CSOJ01_05777 [Colletotrichum sojae]
MESGLETRMTWFQLWSTPWKGDDLTFKLSGQSKPLGVAGDGMVPHPCSYLAHTLPPAQEASVIRMANQPLNAILTAPSCEKITLASLACDAEAMQRNMRRPATGGTQGVRPVSAPARRFWRAAERENVHNAPYDVDPVCQTAKFDRGPPNLALLLPFTTRLQSYRPALSRVPYASPLLALPPPLPTFRPDKADPGHRSK